MRNILFRASNKEAALRLLNGWLLREKVAFDKLVIVTAGSSDESPALAERMSKFDKRIVHSRENIKEEELCEHSTCDELTFDGSAFAFTAMSSEEKRAGTIVLMPDVKDWAFDHIAAQIQKHLGWKYSIKTVYHRAAMADPELIRVALRNADVVLIFWWKGTLSFDGLIPKKCRRIIAVFDNFSYKGQYETAFKDAAERSDLVLVGNEQIGEYLSNLIEPSKIVLCEDGVDVLAFKPKLVSDKLVVGWVGNSKSSVTLTGDEDLKGLHSIIRPVCNNLPFVKLVTRDVSSDKMVPHSEMPMFYRDLDVYVSMSSSEGTPNPALEALATAVPVISTRVGVLPKIIKDGVNGFLIDRTREALSEALHKMYNIKMSNTKLFLEMKTSARANVETDWSWENKVVQYDRAFAAVMSKPPGHREHVDLSDQLTVFVISVGDEVVGPCLEALRQQTSSFRLEIIDRISPMSQAFQQMLNRCKTPYFIQCDEDMILKADSVKKMFEFMVETRAADDKIIEQCWPLFDAHLRRIIAGIKIYYHPTISKYPYPQDSYSCEMAQAKAFEADGYKLDVVWMKTGKRIVGKYDDTDFVGFHGTAFTNLTAFERYRNLFEKNRMFRWMLWIEEWPRRFMHRFADERKTVDLWALLGSVTGMLTDISAVLGEKDFRRDPAEYKAVLGWVNSHPDVIRNLPENYETLVKGISGLFNAPDRAQGERELLAYLRTGHGELPQIHQLSLYMTTKCNLKCKWCRRQHQHIEESKDITVELVNETVAKYPGLKGICVAGFGEPTLCENFKGVMEALSSKGIFFTLITNGTMLLENAEFLKSTKVGYVSVSLNAPNAERYKEVTGMDCFDNVISGLRAAVSSGLDVGISCVVTKKTLSDLPEIIRLAKDIGVKFIHAHNVLPHYSDSEDDPVFWEDVITDEDTEAIAFIEKCKKEPGSELVAGWPVLISKKVVANKCLSPFSSVGIDGEGRITACRRVTPPCAKTEEEINRHYVTMRQSVRSTMLHLPQCKKCFGNWSE